LETMLIAAIMVVAVESLLFGAILGLFYAEYVQKRGFNEINWTVTAAGAIVTFAFIAGPFLISQENINDFIESLINKIFNQFNI